MFNDSFRFNLEISIIPDIYEAVLMYILDESTLILLSLDISYWKSVKMITPLNY